MVATLYPISPQTPIAIISGTGEAADFKFGRYIHRVRPIKSLLKILEKREQGISRNCPHFLASPSQDWGSQPKTSVAIISGTGKATNFKFCTHIHRIDQNKSPLKISEKVAVAILRDSRKFSGYPHYGEHRAVIFVVAQLSCTCV